MGSPVHSEQYNPLNDQHGRYHIRVSGYFYTRGQVLSRRKVKALGKLPGIAYSREYTNILSKTAKLVTPVETIQKAKTSNT